MSFKEWFNVMLIVLGAGLVVFSLTRQAEHDYDFVTPLFALLGMSGGCLLAITGLINLQ